MYPMDIYVKQKNEQPNIQSKQKKAHMNTYLTPLLPPTR